MAGESYRHRQLFYPSSVLYEDYRHPHPTYTVRTESRQFKAKPHVVMPGAFKEIEEVGYWNWWDRKLYADIHEHACKGAAELKRSCMSNSEVDPFKQCARFIEFESHCFERLFCPRESQAFDICLGDEGGPKLMDRCRPIRQSLDACMVRMHARLRTYTQAPLSEPPPSPWWLGTPNNPYKKKGGDDEPEVPRKEYSRRPLPYMDGNYRFWRLRTRLHAMDEERQKDPWTEDWIPTGPTHNPLPLSDDDYLRTEVRLRRAMSGAVSRMTSHSQLDTVQVGRVSDGDEDDDDDEGHRWK